MVEYVIGRNIKSKTDKLIIASKAEDVAALLNDDEKIFLPAIKNQTTADAPRKYDLGRYKLLVGLADFMKTEVDWQCLGGNVWAFIKNFREIKVQIVGAKPENIYNFSLGIELASYHFDKYFTKKSSSFYPKLEKVVYVGSRLKNLDGYKPYAGLANSVRYARDLINEPANAMTPQILADDIKRLEYLGLQVDVLDETKMKELGFNLALAVGQGSVNRPKAVVIKWIGNPEEKGFKIGLVGKGVTFDSGGLSLKSATGMEDMKQDMAGAAVMAAAMKSIALQNIKINVAAVVGLVENMPSSSAYRPGDVFTSMSGQTVEVINTDAEGRLVLADCLTYIQREFKPEYVVDIATLTGAIVAALGSAYAGVFGNSPKVVNTLERVSDDTGERLWHLPMDKEYDKQLNSRIADMKNVGGKAAGSATAACFLRRFIEKNTKWAHIDIAGVDFSDGSKLLYPKGASGFGVRLINRFINQIAKDL